jgi:hypothetical protein
MVPALVKKIISFGLVASLMAFIWAENCLPAESQVVVGSIDPNYCEKIEHLHPNLTIKHNVRIHGTITDAAGTPLSRKPVVLKSYKSPTTQKTVRQVATDDAGTFDLGMVESGRYRLLASWTRSFRQPENLTCQAGNDCNLAIKLVAPPTDGPDVNCPVR